MSKTLQLGIDSRHVGEKGDIRKFQKARGVICHAILDAWVIKNRRVKEELPQMECVEVEKIRHQRIYRSR